MPRLDSSRFASYGSMFMPPPSSTWPSFVRSVRSGVCYSLLRVSTNNTWNSMITIWFKKTWRKREQTANHHKLLLVCLCYDAWTNSSSSSIFPKYIHLYNWFLYISAKHTWLVNSCQPPYMKKVVMFLYTGTGYVHGILIGVSVKFRFALTEANAPGNIGNISTCIGRRQNFSYLRFCFQDPDDCLCCHL